MKRSILVTLFGLFVFVLYLVLAIKSYSKWDDGFGTDYSMDMDLFILCICGLIILILGLYDLYLNVKVKNGIELNVKKAYIYSGLLIGFVTTLYPLGLMFKSIAKKKSNDTILNYFECAIFGGFVLAFAIIYFIDLRKNKNN